MFIIHLHSNSQKPNSSFSLLFPSTTKNTIFRTAIVLLFYIIQQQWL